MTVMPSSSDVADKAVSTEDAKSGGGVEVARLEAVLSALVASKLEALKADAAGAAAQSERHARRAASEPVSPRPRPRLASSSTLSSCRPNHHHRHRHQHQHHSQPQQQHRSRAKQHRRHGSAPCHSELDARPSQPSQPPLRSAALSLVAVDVASGAEPCDYPAHPATLHQSACYMSYSAAQLKGQCDEDEYLAFGYADELCGLEDESPTGLEAAHYRPRPERFHRPRRKRRKRRRRRQRAASGHLVDIEADELELEVVGDPDDLPPRARWTIVATACLLLAMSLLLVGVTLRMAPIIDEMAACRAHIECPISRLDAIDNWPQVRSEMDGRELDYSRRLSSSSEERTLFYIGDLSARQGGGGGHELPSPGSDSSQHQQQQQQQRERPQRSGARRNSSAQCGPSLGLAGAPTSGGGRPRRQRRPSEFAEVSVRRSSSAHQHHRSRNNSYSRPTPLGDGRRASACKRKSLSGSSGRPATLGAAGGSRRASGAAAGQCRRDSVRPDNSRSPSAAGGLLGITSSSSVDLEALTDPREEARARRHRLVALVLLATFVFILLAAVLAVVITLTHSSFHAPPIGSKELQEHRANDAELTQTMRHSPQGERRATELAEPRHDDYEYKHSSAELGSLIDR